MESLTGEMIEALTVRIQSCGQEANTDKVVWEFRQFCLRSWEELDQSFIHSFSMLTILGAGLGIGEIKMYRARYLPKRNNAKECNKLQQSKFS